MAALANPNQKCITLTAELIEKVEEMAAREHVAFAAAIRKIVYHYFENNRVDYD